LKEGVAATGRAVVSGWWPSASARRQDGGARCGSRPRGWWPVILFDMMSMSIRIGEAELGQVCVTVLGDDVHAHRQSLGWPAA